MKTLLITFIVSILFCSTTKILAYCGASVTLKTQQEVDDFILTNPCNWLSNIFIINSSINNLQGLQHITEVTNDIYISSSNALINLSGLENLTVIGGGLHINNNDALVDISTLQNIDYIGDRLEITGNIILTDISGLQNVTSVNNDITITDNILLSNIALNNLTSANKHLIIGRNALTNLNGLNNLSYIGGSLLFNKADLLIDFSGLENLTEVKGNLHIVDNASVENFIGLNSLALIRGFLEINNNPSLTDLSGFTNLSIVLRDCFVQNNNSLINLSGLENLNTIVNTLQISNNNSLENISALQNLNIVGSVSIENNPSLTSLAGLDNISDGPNEYIILNNNMLSSCNTNSICNHLESNGNHSISSNAPGCDNGGEVLVVCDADLPRTYIDGEDIIATVEGQSVTFTHSSSNYTNLVWTFSNASSSILDAPTVLYENSGTYTVNLETTNSNGSVSDNILVIVGSRDNSSICTESTLVYPNPSTIINNTVEKVSDYILIETGVNTVKIESGDTVKLIAGERITINSNFSVKDGARASFYIDACFEDCSVAYFNNLYGKSGNEVIHSFTQTNDGGYVGAGFSRSGDSYFWVLKLSNTGEVEWENIYPNVFETLEDSEANSIKQTQDGGYIVVGYIDIYLLDYYTPEHKEIGIIKLDEYGNLLWSKQMHNIDNVPEPFFAKGGSDTGKDIIQNKDGDYILASYTINGWDDFKCQISKLDNSGELIWYNEAFINRIPQFIEQTADGNYFVGGEYFASGNTIGSRKMWLAKLDKNGNDIIWSQIYDLGGSSKYVSSFTIDNDGGYTICGYSVVNDDTDIWVIKTDENGEIVWNKSYGGGEDEFIYSIYSTFDGGYVLGGYTKSSNSGDVSEINKGGFDAWVVKLDALGNIEWEKLVGSDEDDRLRQIEQTCEGGYIICGYTYGSTNGNITDINNGSADAWVMKLSPFGDIIQ